MADRIVPEDRIKNITISTTVTRRELSNDKFMKVTKTRMIEALAKSIAHRLFLFDKVLVRRRDAAKSSDIILDISFDIIVPKGKPMGDVES